MKVSERIKELRSVLDNAGIGGQVRFLIEYPIAQVEAEIIVELLIAEREGYKVGYREGLRMCNLQKTGG